jgi:hypothetical protein
MIGFYAILTLFVIIMFWMALIIHLCLLCCRARAEAREEEDIEMQPVQPEHPPIRPARLMVIFSTKIIKI